MTRQEHVWLHCFNIIANYFSLWNLMMNSVRIGTIILSVLSTHKTIAPSDGSVSDLHSPRGL